MSLPKLYPAGKNDECFTPAYGVKPLLKYMDKSKSYWCPFDKEDSEFVREFKAAGFEDVWWTHIDDGFDFFNFTPGFHFDCIISNPPFTGKRKIFERAISFNKPFALLMSNTWLNDAAPKQLFKKIGLQLLMFEERMKFKGQGDKITFSSSYFCRDFLPKQIVMDSLKEYM